MSKNSGSSTTTNETTYPQYIQDAQEATVNAAVGMAAPHIQGSDYTIAGQNEDQLMAAELARNSALAANNTDYSTQMAAIGSNGDRSAQIAEYMNPYTESVGRDVLAEMRREKVASDAAIGARNASGVAFGGSGPALERAQLERSYGQNVGEAINSINSSAYESAVNQMNTDQAMELSQLQAADSAANNTFNRQQSSLDNLLNIGNQNQTFAQSQIDAPWTNLNRVIGVVNGTNAGATTTSSTPTYTNPLETIMGVGSLFG